MTIGMLLVVLAGLDSDCGVRLDLLFALATVQESSSSSFSVVDG